MFSQGQSPRSTEATTSVVEGGQSSEQRGSSIHAGFMGVQNAKVMVLWKFVQVFQKARGQAGHARVSFPQEALRETTVKL